jgi:hypothetical protein
MTSTSFMSYMFPELVVIQFVTDCALLCNSRKFCGEVHGFDFEVQFEVVNNTNNGAANIIKITGSLQTCGIRSNCSALPPLWSRRPRPELAQAISRVLVSLAGQTFPSSCPVLIGWVELQ